MYIGERAACSSSSRELTERSDIEVEKLRGRRERSVAGSGAMVGDM